MKSKKNLLPSKERQGWDISISVNDKPKLLGDISSGFRRLVWILYVYL